MSGENYTAQLTAQRQADFEADLARENADGKRAVEVAAGEFYAVCSTALNLSSERCDICAGATLHLSKGARAMSITKLGCLALGLLLLGTGLATRPVEAAKERFARVNQHNIVATTAAGV